MTLADMLCLHNPAAGAWGDCTRACIASIFDLPAHEVPHFTERGGEPRQEDGRFPWEIHLRQWLHDRGFSLLVLEFRSASEVWEDECLPFHYIRGGESVRSAGFGGVGHDVVYYGNQMVHDPHPSCAGIRTDVYPQSALIFVRR